MNFNHLARFGVLVAIVALPACSGGGASAPAMSAAIPSVISQTESVKLKPVNLRSSIVAPAVANVHATNLRSSIVAPAVANVHATNLRSSIVVPALANVHATNPGTSIVPIVKAVLAEKAASVRLSGPRPNAFVKPSNLRSDIVSAKATIKAVNLRTDIVVDMVPATVHTSSVRLLPPGINHGPR
jgi:hypothetical protein